MRTTSSTSGAPPPGTPSSASRASHRGARYSATVRLAATRTRAAGASRSAATEVSKRSEASITSRAHAAVARPVSVSRDPRVVRSRRSRPRRRSSARRPADAVGWATPSARAAALIDPCESVATSSSSAERDVLSRAVGAIGPLYASRGKSLFCRRTGRSTLEA
ncbi:Uncharacterised protein [Mycobacteroides abscessus]|nr:Uncharacterised protein [Mycobacteroides abscessus]